MATSPLPNAARPLRPAAVPRDFLRFLRSPDVLDPVGLRAPGAFGALAVLAALNFAVLLLVVLPFIAAWQDAFDLPAPTAFGEMDARYLPFFAIVLAPVSEEMLFRGWQTGRPRALWLLGCALAAIALVALTLNSARPVMTATGLAGLAALAGIGWMALRNHPTPAAYWRFYPLVFYAVVALFSLAHVLNYPSVSLAGVALVLPQFWSALVLGYTRIRIGLTGSILVHAVSNALALGAAQLSG